MELRDRTEQDLLAERRANVLEREREPDETGRLTHHINRIDAELIIRRELLGGSAVKVTFDTLADEQIPEIDRILNARHGGTMTTTTDTMDTMGRNQSIEDATEIGDIVRAAFNDCRMSRELRERLAAVLDRSDRIARNLGGGS